LGDGRDGTLRAVGCGAALLACLLAAGPVAAQESVHNGSIAGRVTDAQGGVVPGATVTAQQTQTTVETTTSTDASGRFRLPYLRVGDYDVRVVMPGFGVWTQALTLTAGAAFEIPVTLQAEGVTTDIVVTARAPVIESARSQLATTITEAEVQRLPLNGRQFLDIALVAPGVAPPNINSTQLFAETSAVPGVGLSVGSQRNLSNSFIVDGLSSNDDAAGLTGMPYGVDAIEQFQVVTSGGQAELGRALGGYVNVVTRSGTNATRGTLYGFFRDDRLNAVNALSGTRLPMNQQQFGGSLGGPLRRGRAFYFANLEQRSLAQTGVVTISPSAVATVNSRLAAAAYPGQPVTTGTYESPVTSLHGLGKVDVSTQDGDHLSLRYSLYDVTAENARGAGGLSAPSASSGLDNTDQAVAVSYTRSLGPRTVSESRAQYTRSALLALPSDQVGPTVSIAGVASFGTLASSPQGRRNDMYQLVQTVAHQRGAHALRAGIDVVLNDDTITFPRALRGSYTFSSLATFLSGTYNNAGFTQTFGDTAVEQRSLNIGLYAQDEWHVSPALTFNLGLRYDVQSLRTITTDTNNVSPRIGLAWTPGASRRTVVRASAGLFFDRVPLRALANALLSADNTTDLSRLRQRQIALTPGQAGAPVFPQILSAPVPSVTLFNLTTMQTDLQNAYSRQASAEVERQVGRTLTASAGYAYVRGDGLLMAINQNVPTCVASGANNGCRPVMEYGNNSQYRSAGMSTYHALMVSVAQRPARWGYYRLSYTLAKAMNNLGEFFFSGPIDPTDLSKDWGRADNDRRHMAVISAGINSPTEVRAGWWNAAIREWQLSAVLQAYSAAPFNITSGLTTVQGTAGRPVINGAFIERNEGEADEFFTLNLRAGRTFRLGTRLQLETAAELFNATNAVNELARNTNFGSGIYPTSPSATFNQVTAVGDPRSAQVAVRLRF
jgi:outer membrane receptor protein involved in Fe transport